MIIYLTPYIVRTSGDLQKLKALLSELDSVQEQYNKIVLENLEDRGGAFTSKGSASGRIRRSPDVYRGPAPVTSYRPTRNSRGPVPKTETPSSRTVAPVQSVKKKSTSSRISNSSVPVVASAEVEEEGFFSSLFSSSKTPEATHSSQQGSRGPYNPDFGDR